MEQLGRITPTMHDFHTVMRYNDVEVLSFGAKYYTFSSEAFGQPIQRINAFYKNAVSRYIKYCHNRLYQDAIEAYTLAEENHYPFPGYESLLYYMITYNQNCSLSLYSDNYTFTGGAHGSTLRTSETWSLNTGRRLILSDLFRRPRYRQTLFFSIIGQIEDQLKENPGIYFDNYKELVVSTFNPSSFYLTPNGLAIYYQQYDIAPYSTGIPVFIMPYDEIGAVIPKCMR